MTEFRLQSGVLERFDKRLGKSFWTARIRFRDAGGKLKTVERRGRNKTHAKALLDQLKAKYANGPDAMPSIITFADVADRYLAEKVTPAVIVNGRKVAGFKHPAPEARRVKALKTYFGEMALSAITAKHIEDYKAHLYALPTHRGGQRKAADVNHFLRRLRHVLNWAVKRGWLAENPFKYTENIINAADEVPRSRPEQAGELDALLAACTGGLRYMRAWVALAAETAARANEIQGLLVSDLDFDAGVIRLDVSTTKTARERWVPMSDWLRNELKSYIADAQLQPGEKLFHLKGVSGWRRLKARAGLPDLQRRDLRHWATTRLLGAMATAGLSPTHTMIITGHTVERTFRRYVDAPVDTARAAAMALNKLRELPKAESEAR